MEPTTVEGTWEQITQRAREFAGHRVRVTILDELAVHDDEEAFKQHLLGSGLVRRFPSALDTEGDEDDAPIAIAGEPVSETLLRERR